MDLNVINTFFKFITISLLYCTLVGCAKEKDPLIMQTIELKRGPPSARFSIPNAYRLRANSNQVVSLTVKYPSMKPEDPNLSPLINAVSIYITLGSGIGRIEKMVSRAATEFNPSLPGKAFYAGQEEEYKIYRIGRDPSRNDTYETKTYVFKATDGALVGVTDIGNSSNLCDAFRKFGTDIDIHYLIPKQLGKDFKKIDDKVLEFLKNHIILE